ncbi:hypothetical protein SUGI_0739090 [Cryptomeria japonica]|nr:hypothetical protein SUGI_0739090 [Cryptomeria japonica]
MKAEVFLAAKNGDLDAIKKLHGQNPKKLKEVTFEGNTILHLAAKERHLELLQWILQNVKGLYGVRNANRNMPLAISSNSCGDLDILLLHANHLTKCVKEM